MSLSTLNLLGKYALTSKKHPRNKSELKLLELINNLLAERRVRIKKAKSVAISPATESEKLMDITEGAHDTLLTANTVFPFVLFPDTINIDKQKLTIVHRSFFRMAGTLSVQIDDVQLVKVDVGPFFGSVHLASKYFVDNIQSINFLSRADAIRIQRLLQGYMIAHHRQIDCSSIDNEQLIILLNDLGQGSTD